MGLAFKDMQKFRSTQISPALQPPTGNVRKWEVKDPVPSHTHTEAQVCISLRTGTLAIVSMTYQTVTAIFPISKAQQKISPHSSMSSAMAQAVHNQYTSI